MSEIKVTPHHSASYIDSNPKKLDVTFSFPYVCVSYIGTSESDTEPYEGQVTGTVDGNTDIAHLTPTTNVSYIDSSPKKLDAVLSRPYVCVSYVPASAIEVIADFDLSRKLANVVTVNYDICRNDTKYQEVNIDTSRSIEKSTNLSADTLRDVAKTISVDFDTSRNVRGEIPVDFSVDIVRNVTKSQDLNVDLARSVSAPVEINFDTCREVTDSSIWRYENYGTASLLKVSGNTVTGLDASKSRTGSAFWQNQRVAAFPIPATKELWVKFDLYYGGTQWRAYDRLDGKDTGVSRYQKANSLTSFINGPLEYTLNPQNSITSDKLYTFLLHMVSDTENGLVELWVDGVKYYSNDFADEGLIYKGNVENGANFENFYLQSADKNNLFSNVIISNAPIGLGENVLGYNIQWFFDFDLARQKGYSCQLNIDSERNVTNGITVCVDVNRNVQSPVNLFFDTSRTVSKAQAVPIVLNLDTLRAVTNNVDFFVDSVRNLNCTINFFLDTLRKTRTEAFFRYENYGTADLLTVTGKTLENLDKSQSVYQTAFYQTERVKCFDIPATKEIWIKCDVYVRESSGVWDHWRIYNGRANYTTGVRSYGVNDLHVWVNDTRVKYLYEKVKHNQLQTILLHMVSDAENGLVEAWVDGEKLNYTYTGNVNEGDDFADIYIQSEGAWTFFSNVIISNDEIGLHDNVKINKDFLCDTFRFEPIAYQASIDICRDIIKPITQTNDTCLNIVHSQSIDFDTFLFIESTVQFNADLVRALPHEIILSPLAESADLIDTSNDDKAQLQSLEIRLNEQYLTDELIITTVRPMDIMEQVKGQYLDYKFDMRIETEKQRGVLRTCTCCSDIDEILYKQLEYTIPEDELWRYTNPDEVKQSFPGLSVFYANSQIDSASLDDVLEADDNSENFALASTHIATIAGIIGKAPILQFADFISTVDITSGGTTYNDLIRSIFGWSARTPQHLVNCYLRDDKLFVVERGYEANEINLNNLSSYEIVGIDKELVRTIWGSSVWSKTETREVFGFRYLDNLKWSNEEDDEEEEDPDDKPQQRPTSTRNTGGLIKKRIEEHDGVTTTTEYEYTDDELVAKTIITVESKEFYTTRTTTTYEYATLEDGRRVLEKETIEETVNVNGRWRVVDNKTTKHEYTATGPGQVHHYNTDSEGNTSNVLGNGVYDDRRTPYAKFITTKGHKRLLSYTSRPKYFQQQRTIYGLTEFDTSFPVHGDSKLIEITNAIKWLNRRTQETITVNIFDYPHVIDFNDRLILNGNAYYLKNNTALKTSRIVNKQTLTMVRWY